MNRTVTFGKRRLGQKTWTARPLLPRPRLHSIAAAATALGPAVVTAICAAAQPGDVRRRGRGGLRQQLSLDCARQELREHVWCSDGGHNLRGAVLSGELIRQHAKRRLCRLHGAAILLRRTELSCYVHGRLHHTELCLLLGRRLRQRIPHLLGPWRRRGRVTGTVAAGAANFATLATAAGVSQTTAGHRLSLGPTCATIPRASQSTVDHTITVALAALAAFGQRAVRCRLLPGRQRRQVRLQCYRLGRHHNLARWYVVDFCRRW